MSVAPPKFEPICRTIALDAIVTFRDVKLGRKRGKYQQILTSIKAMGLVESPVVYPLPKKPGKYGLLDGHLRIQALRELGYTEVACLLALDDDTFTYNRQINRLAPAQDYQMIAAAIKHGVPESRLAAALNLSESAFHKRKTLMDGVCPEARAMLADKECPREIFSILKRLKPIRQIEACELMEGQGNYSTALARAILGATPPDQMVTPRTKPMPQVSLERLAQLERELTTLREQMQIVERTYSSDVLRFTVIQAYLGEILASASLTSILQARYPEFLKQFHRITEMSSLPEPETTVPAGS